MTDEYESASSSLSPLPLPNPTSTLEIQMEPPTAQQIASHETETAVGNPTNELQVNIPPPSPPPPPPPLSFREKKSKIIERIIIISVLVRFVIPAASFIHVRNVNHDRGAIYLSIAYSMIYVIVFVYALLAFYRYYGSDDQNSNENEINDNNDGIIPHVVWLVVILFPVTSLITPFLIVSYLVVWLLQFIRHNDAYENLVVLKFNIRSLIVCFFILSIAPVLAVVPVGGGILKCISGSILSTIISTALLAYAFNRVGRIQLDHSESGINILEGLVEIFDCGSALLCLLLINKTTDYFVAHNRHKILDLEDWKWAGAVIVIIIVNNTIKIVTRVVVWGCLKAHSKIATARFSRLQKQFRTRHLSYWANGMKHSINFLLSSLLLLLAWVLYFKPRVNLKTPLFTPKFKPVWEIGKWTCICFLVCAFLWLIKTFVILSWKAASIYIRLESRILQGAKQLYLLGIIGRHKYDLFNLLYRVEETPETNVDGWISETQAKVELILTSAFTFDLNDYFHRDSDPNDLLEIEKKFSQEKKKRVEHVLMMADDLTPTIHGLQQAAHYFLMAQTMLLKKNYASTIIENLQSYNNGVINVGRLIVEEKNLEYFQGQLDDSVAFSDPISDTVLKAWMEKAHKNCLFLANTFSSANEVVDCLNNIIKWLIIFGLFIVWLLLTGLATTKVLVLIAAPFLAVTFIFQNTCKTMFDGIMFAYVVHPFHVGDLCIIEETMMEVTTVGIWKTTFSKVDTQEEVVYLNLQLSQKKIVNSKTEFDWNDSVELDVNSLGSQKIENLKQQIETYLDSENDRFTSACNSVEVKTTEDKYMLVVYFRHEVQLNNNNTFFECLKVKRNQRSQLLLKIGSIVDGLQSD